LKLQKNTRLALYSVLEFAARPDEHVPASEVAQSYGESVHHLAKVLSELARAGIVEAVRGVGGGYRFVANPRRLTLLDVIELFEDPSGEAPRAGDAVSAVDRALGEVWDEIDQNTRATLGSITVATLPYPGFPTDLQPFALAYDAVAEGSAMITENLFEARFRTVQELARLGMEARIDGHHVMVHGRPLLSGAPVEASDIRAGAALVLAGLVADGVTTVGGVHHIDRGYAGFELSLRSLGADVVREPDDSPAPE
jgi:Rrf2 family protein